MLIARETDLNEISQKNAAGVDALQISTAPTVPRDLTWSETVNAQVAKLQSTARQVEDSVLEFVDGAVAPINSSRRVIGLLDFTAGEANFLIDELYIRGDAAVHLADDLVELGQIAVPAMIAGAKMLRDITRAARRQKHQASRQRVQLIRKNDSELLGTFYATEDVDLRDVSTEWYSTPDQWRDLMIFNGFQTSRLALGQLVMVPQLSAFDDLVGEV